MKTSSFMVEKLEVRYLGWNIRIRIRLLLSWSQKHHLKNNKDFPGGPGVKNPPANAGDSGSIPSLGRPHIPQSN